MMNRCRGLSPLITLLLLGIVTSGFANAFDGKMPTEQLAAMKGQPLTLELRSGLRIDDISFVQAIADPRSGSIRFIEYQKGRRAVKQKAEDVYRIHLDGRPHRLRYHSPTGTYHWIDEAVAEAQMLARLEGMKRNLTEPVPPESMDELNDQHREFVRDAIRKLNNPQLRVEENDCSILITDFSPAQASAFSKMIPVVFTYMNRQFGVPQNQTVLPGKAIIAVFGQRENFANFETVVMDNANFGDISTLWRFNSRRSLIVRHDKAFDHDSIRAICLTLADGYFGRIHSDAPLPVWLAVGLRGTIADAAVPRDERTQRRDRESVAAQLRRAGSLDRMLQATEIPNDRRLIAKLLVQYLIRRDPAALSQFLADLKAGQPQEAALMMNYELTNEMLASEFGLSLGIPNFRH